MRGHLKDVGLALFVFVLAASAYFPLVVTFRHFGADRLSAWLDPFGVIGLVIMASSAVAARLVRTSGKGE